VTIAPAFAKVNLGLVAGPLRADGKHEVATVLQRVALHDDVELEPSTEAGIEVVGFADDTLVRTALRHLAQKTSFVEGWRVRLGKRIPVASGLGGGSSDAAAALRLANELLSSPLAPHELHMIAARVGADVPFFLTRGAQLGEGDGGVLTPVGLPLEYSVVLALADEESKASTADVYDRFDRRAGAEGFERRRAALLEALERVETAAQLAALPRNDLATSPLADRLEELGAFRADVTGAGPTVYGLFAERGAAEHAAASLAGVRWTWVGEPATGP